MTASPISVAPTQHSPSFMWGSRTAPEFGLRRRGRSPLLMALGELHGRNLASALMRSRVHNRTRDRGGKPRLARPWALPPVLPEGPGRSLAALGGARPKSAEGLARTRQHVPFGR